MAEIHNWPDGLLPSKQSIRLKSNRKKFTSPFTGTSQTVHYPGSKWSMDLSFERLDNFESTQLETLLYKLDRGGVVRVPDFGRAGTNQTGITVLGGDQTGTLLVTQGWQPNLLIAIEEGQYIEVNGELKYVTATSGSNAAGQVTIEIAPMLRGSPQSGSPVELQNPCGYFMLDEDEAGVDRSPAMINDISFTLIESFYPGLVG